MTAVPSIAWRWAVLLLLAAATVWALFRLVNPTGSEVKTVRPVLSRPIDPVVAVALRRVKAQPNPAMQKAGPPDPVAQKSASTSAEKAARAAAELASSVASTN
jgi:hypothetical protein